VLKEREICTGMHELCSRQAGYQKLGVVESGVIR
jgi:hypothetical protein